VVSGSNVPDKPPEKPPEQPPEPPPVDPTNTLPGPPKQPEVVNVKITGAPEGAEVYAGGKLVGVVPDVQLPRGETPLLLTFQLEGWRPATQKVTPDKDQQVKVAMKPKKGGGKGGKGGKGGDGRNTLEDPFKTNP
jgi:hypothetical protein